MDSNKIIEILNKKNAVKPCSRCGNSSFSFVGYTKIMMDDQMDGSIRIGGPVVPSAIIACSNCGAITMHALGALGLLNNNEASDGKN